MTMLVLYSLLLIALAYVIGCILGCLARRFFSAKEEPRYVARAEDNRYGRPAAVAGGAAAAAVAATAAKPKPAPVAKAAPAPKVVAKPKPAAKKPAAKKPAAAKPTGGASQANIKASAVEMKIPKAQAAKAAEADKAGKRPLVLGAPLGSGKDNLKRVKGIGPVNEKSLNGLGIYHFSQIGAWKQKEADWVGTFLAFPGRIDREDWISQAKLLAAGKDTDFSKRVDKGQVGSSKGKKK